MNNTASISIEPWILWLLIAIAVFNALVLIWLAVRRADKAATAAAVQGKTELLGAVSTSASYVAKSRIPLAEAGKS
jgi:hypothetical protein